MAKQRRLRDGATRLIFTEGSSNKFYDILVHEDEDADWCYTVHYGKVGTAGSFQTKAFDSREEAESAAAKQVRSKRNKGYVTNWEVVGTIAPASSPVAAANAGARQPEHATSGKRRRVIRD